MSRFSSTGPTARTVPQKLAAGALALSIAGLGLAALLPPNVLADEAVGETAAADASQAGEQAAAVEPDQADGQIAAAEPGQTQGQTAQSSASATVPSPMTAALLQSTLQAQLGRELYGEVPDGMELEYHNRTVTFSDIDDGDTVTRTSLTDEPTLCMAVVESQIGDWAALAYNVIGHADPDDSEKNNKLFIDHAGNGFDKDFGSDGHYLDLYSAFMSAGSGGDKGDYWKSTGLSYASSLSQVYDDLVDNCNSLVRDGSGDTSGYTKYCTIDALQDDTSRTVIYTNVSQVDREGSTSKHYVNGFGIAFYDFEVHPLPNGSNATFNGASEGIDGYEYTSQENEATFVTQSKNMAATEATVSVTLSKGSSETISNATSGSESVTYGQSIGLDWTNSITAIPKVYEVGINVGADISFDEAYSTAWSEEGSLTKDINESANVSVTLPAHTVACTKQVSSTGSLTESYDVPVGITFKVMIYSLNTGVYNTGGAINDFKSYDHHTFSTVLGANADAVEDLYQRAVVHKGDASYDRAYGNVVTSGTQGDKLIDYVDWNSVLKGGDRRPALDIDALSSTYPMSVDGAVTNVEATSIDTTLEDPKPLYPIAKISVQWQFDRTKSLSVGDEFTLSSQTARVSALDKDSVEYYGFVATSGSWKVVDAEGNEVTDPSVIRIDTDAITHEQTVVALTPGEAYIKYFIPEDTYTDAYGNVSTNAGIDSAAYKVVVAEEVAPAFEGTIVVNGAPQLTVGDTGNLNDLCDVAAYDTTGKEVEAQVSWEAQELESRGISVAEDGTVTATQPGTFHVRAFQDGVYSDWVELVAVAAEPEAPEVPEAPADEVVPDEGAGKDAAPAEDEPAGEDVAPAKPAGDGTAPEEPSEGDVPEEQPTGEDGAAAEEQPAEDVAAEDVTVPEGQPVEDAAQEGGDVAAPVRGNLEDLVGCIYQYGVAHGYITDAADALTQNDYYVMGVLYCAAKYEGLVPAETVAEMDQYLAASYTAEQVALWKQQALAAMIESGYIPVNGGGDTPADEGETAAEDAGAPEEPAAEPAAEAQGEVAVEPEPAAQEEAAPAVEPEAAVEESAEPAMEPAAEESATVEAEQPEAAPSPFAGVWLCTAVGDSGAPASQVEFIFDPNSPMAVATQNRTDGAVGTWTDNGDGTAMVTFGATTLTMYLADGVLMADYNATPLQFVASTL